MELIQEKQKTAFDALKKDFGWTNRMQAPRIEKVVISVGVGKMLKDKGKVELVADRLAKITGQKPAARTAKKAISTYKTRIGDKIGYQIPCAASARRILSTAWCTSRSRAPRTLRALPLPPSTRWATTRSASKSTRSSPRRPTRISKTSSAWRSRW